MWRGVPGNSSTLASRATSALPYIAGQPNLLREALVRRRLDLLAPELLLEGGDAHTRVGIAPVHRHRVRSRHGLHRREQASVGLTQRGAVLDLRRASFDLLGEASAGNADSQARHQARVCELHGVSLLLDGGWSLMVQ